MWTRIVSALWILFCISLDSAAQAENRIALVVGISRYTDMNQLTNPVADAKAVAALLEQNGFKVVFRENVDRGAFLDALEEFEYEAQGAEVALIYYSGHGLNIRGQDVVAPSDMRVECNEDRAHRAIKLTDLVKPMTNVPKQIVVLDACRNDPTPNCRTRGNAGGFRGLQRLQSSRRLIVSSTAEGNVASDGEPGDHSPFTLSLLKHFRNMPEVYFLDIFSLVSGEVSKATFGRQVPELKLGGGGLKICLKGRGSCIPIENFGKKLAHTDPARPVAPPTPPSADDTSVCDRKYAEARRSDDKKAALQRYIRLCPDHAEVARAKDTLETMAETEDCDRCLTDKSYSACQSYLDFHPSGRCRQMAKDIIASLLPAEPEPEPPRQQPTPQPELPGEPARTFRIYSGYDLYGGDYARVPGNVTYETCLSTCRSDTRCNAFTFNTSAQVCFLKSRVPQLRRFVNAISGILESRPQPREEQVKNTIGMCGAGFTSYNNVDFFANDIGGYGVSFNRCRELCSGNADCKAFAWIKKQVSQRCWLKYALSPPSTSGQVLSCVKQ